MAHIHITVIKYKPLPSTDSGRTELGMYVAYPVCGFMPEKLDRQTMRIDFPLNVDCPACLRRATWDGLV